MGSAFYSSGRLNMRVFLGVFACVAAASATTLLQAQWSKFKADHGKVYTSSAEEALRMSIFAQNVAKIEAQNRAGQSWKSGINQFTDLTKEEFVSTYASGKIASRAPRQPVNYEYHHAKINNMTHDLIELSPQHLVSCVPNPLKCGGTGG